MLLGILHSFLQECFHKPSLKLPAVKEEKLLVGSVSPQVGGALALGHSVVDLNRVSRRSSRHSFAAEGVCSCVHSQRCLAQ